MLKKCYHSPFSNLEIVFIYGPVLIKRNTVLGLRVLPASHQFQSSESFILIHIIRGSGKRCDVYFLLTLWRRSTVSVSKPNTGLLCALAGSEVATADISLSLSLYWPVTPPGTSLRFRAIREYITFTFAVKLSFTRLPGQRLSISSSHVTEQHWIKTWQSHNRDCSALQLILSCKDRSQLPVSFLSACRKFAGVSMRAESQHWRDFSGPGPGHRPLVLTGRRWSWWLESGQHMIQYSDTS